MNILYDYQVFSWQKYGGISRYFCETASRIAKVDGNKIEIIAPFYINEYFHDNCNVRAYGIKIPQLPRSSFMVLTANEAVSRLLLKPRQNVDIFHETYYSTADNCPRSAKRIITVYDMVHEKFAATFPLWDKTKQNKVYAVNRADHVICISESTRRDLIELLGVPKEKISVVYLGHSFILNEKVSSFSAVCKRPYILYVGGRNKYKNFEGMLRAFASSKLLKNEFSIVCFGGGGFDSRELALMASLNIPTENIKYKCGDDKILASLYASAAAFVYPSLYEGFGIPPLEAMSFGCPVVSSNTSSLPEVVGDAAEMFDPANEAEMCAAIEQVVSSPVKTQQLVVRGYERIKNFSWEKCAQDTLNVYKKVLEG
jgi:glycosyltransferase involved in cell wall biosynthesis